MNTEDRGSLPIAMLITLVGVLLSTLLVNTVVQQATTTRTATARVAALNAAQTGLDVAIGHIRSARDGTAGVLAELPCGSRSGAVTALSAASTTTNYAVTIDYYATDPQNKDSNWLSANAIRCLSGGGAYSTPSYALIRSTGTYSGEAVTTTSRVLKATYTFQTSDVNIPGGLIHVYKTATSTDLCIDAGSGNPAAGTPATMQACSSGNVAQTWAYNANLTLSLVSSKTTTMPLGMCLDAGSSHAIGSVVYVQPCATTTQPQQQWSFNGSANFEGTKNGNTTDGFCFNVQTINTIGSYIVLGSTTKSTCAVSNPYDNRQTWTPEATVGAGAASATNGQLVNFKQFGRCIDVTEGKVGFGYLIVWPCKQTPNPANLNWNQKYGFPTIVSGTTGVSGLLTTNPPAGLYCLQSPRSTLSGQYVVPVKCTSTATAANLRWTFYGNTGTYKTSYTIVDASGYCLSATDPDVTNADVYTRGLKVSKVVVADCDGSAVQKWNAPATILNALPLKDITEN